MAKVLAKKLEEFEPMFIEEPVLCELLDDRVVRARIDLETAGQRDRPKRTVGSQRHVIRLRHGVCFKDGYADLPHLPGTGIDINKELVISENMSPHA